MVVIAYGFRDVLREELLPAAMVQVAGDTIELRRGSDGHFHASLEINGRPVRFMIDTGASDIVLVAPRRRAGRHRARQPQLPRPRPDRQRRRRRPRRSGSAVVEFGDFTDTDVRASVNAGALDTSLLGMSYLDRFSSDRDRRRPDAAPALGRVP